MTDQNGEKKLIDTGMEVAAEGGRLGEVTGGAGEGARGHEQGGSRGKGVKSRIFKHFGTKAHTFEEFWAFPGLV